MTEQIKEDIRRIAEQIDAELTPRPVLSNFAKLMEAKLRKNDHKTTWANLPVEALFRLLMVEIEEFKVAHEFLSVEEAQNELIDVSNYCMILHDRLGMKK